MPPVLDLLCFGENHREDCPVELARQDLIAALNKLDMVDPLPP